MFPVPKVSFIPLKLSSVTSFLFVITVLAIVEVLPVFFTLYPAFSNSFFAFSAFDLSPEPFSNSTVISFDVVVFVVVVFASVFSSLFYFASSS